MTKPSSLAGRFYKATGKYLTRYAEQESERVDGMTGEYACVAVLPLYKENLQRVLDLLQSLQADSGVLVVLVVNCPAGENLPVCVETCALYDNLYRYAPCRWQGENLSLHRLTASGLHDLDYLLVDRCQYQGINPRQGVGLARKIGADIACQLIHAGQIASPWVSILDADVVLPRHYLSEVRSQLGVDATFSAALVPYRHLPSGDKALDSATDLYARSLDYYVCGLAWAGSTYGFHALGSILHLHYGHYGAVRGFPARAAGEDFYLLNKIAKTGRIRQLKRPKIGILSRESDRVPFGTGPAVAGILAQPLSQFVVYHPVIFLYLRAILGYLDDRDGGDYLLRDGSVVGVSGATLVVDPHRLKRAIDFLGLDEVKAEGQARFQRPDTYRHYLHCKMDGFRTLKLVHFFRDRWFPSIPLETALEMAPFPVPGNRLAG